MSNWGRDILRKVVNIKKSLSGKLSKMNTRGDIVNTLHKVGGKLR